MTAHVSSPVFADATDRRGSPRLSLVVSTLGRSAELGPFLQSLENQTERDFELIVVDQNEDDRLVPLLDPARLSFPILHLRDRESRGVNAGRNAGAARARGEIILFPDDDCWYPPWLFERSLACLDRTGADLLTGRAADEAGRTINGRFLGAAGPIRRDNVFETQIEWLMFFRRAAFEATGGFDPAIGPGSGTPWQSCEGVDIILRALALGYRGHYDPSLIGHHAELDIRTPDAAMRRKARGYARGMGYVMRKHGYRPSFAYYRICRPLAGLAMNLSKLNGSRSRYYANVFAGRLEGYRTRS
ncbi:glycosyl transferase [Aureimonas endophytica]|uniref:Glycosyl transferase n=1 Tax=Aureimonas endophytica TaxID=2027858 RepID=A0A916ZH82_9HYPH|nr:glycosyltransferase family A protein [Aureimonas endophytica]GGD95906.1 glycosyl transferase [Aureimonas endophytica]